MNIDTTFLRRCIGTLESALGAIGEQEETDDFAYDIYRAYVDAPRWASKILRRVGGSLVRYCRMFGLLMRLLLAAGPYGVREIGSKSAWRAPRPSARYWFFRPRLADCLPIPRSFVLLPTSPGSFSFFLIPSFLAPAQAAA